MQVIYYVQKLFESRHPKVKPEHIGIISPYHQQVSPILIVAALQSAAILNVVCI